MKLEDQVCSLESAKRLKELGVRQDSYFYWNGIMTDVENKLVGIIKNDFSNDGYSAFTVAELGEMLPPFVVTEKYLCRGKPRFMSCETETMECHAWHDDRESEARAKMLIHLLEQGIVTAEEMG